MMNRILRFLQRNLREKTNRNVVDVDMNDKVEEGERETRKSLMTMMMDLMVKANVNAKVWMLWMWMWMWMRTRMGVKAIDSETRVTRLVVMRMMIQKLMPLEKMKT